MKEELTKVLDKANYRNQKLVIAAIISGIVGVIITITRSTIIWDRAVIITGVLFFLLLHFIIPLKKMYNFICDKRYWIALVFMIYVMIFEYSGSSIGMYSQVIQPEAWEKYETPIIRNCKKYTFR